MKITDIARAEIGTKESPPNSNNVKYNTWFYDHPVQGPSFAWCGTFVSWVYASAGFPLGNIGYIRGYAGCDTALNHFRASGEIVSREQVKEGDIILFDWNGDGRCDHTGIFLRDLGNGTFESIEGNTSVGNDSDGGEVMIRQRSYGAVKAFIHPKILNV